VKYCKLCKVHVDTNANFCPLCYNHLSNEDEKTTAEMFKSASTLSKQKPKLNLVAKIFLMLSLVAIAVCVVINFYTKTPAWSVVVTLSIGYLWLIVCHTILSHDVVFRKILFQIVWVLLLLTSTNVIFGGNEWLTDYVFPSIAMFVALVLSVVLIFLKKRKRVVFSFLSIIVLLAIVSGVLLIFKLDDFQLLNQISLIVDGLLVVSYFIFGGRTILSEISRKFHI
jgi:hypothetical protein